MDRNNLPHYTTPFIGREAEISAIAARLTDPNCRLLTLVGPGGIGKTRLAIEAAASLAQNFEDGRFFVALQPVDAVDSFVRTVGSAIGFEFSTGSTPERQLQQYFQQQDLLLILDNMEHLLGATGMISRLLAEAARLKLLVTSRESLNVRDEWLYQVQGLSFPQQESGLEVGRYAAVRLFAAHAGRVQRGFSLAAEQDAVIQICRLVQGMPLGIELAAKWRRRLPSAAISRELQRSLDILQSDFRDTPDRHSSMRAVFDHSWKLLTAEERRVFMALSVFRGGCRRDAAAEVAGASLAVLMRLVDKSMLRVGRDGRYEIHELQRQYAAERLAEESMAWQLEIHDRHSAYYTGFVNRPINDFLSARSQETLKTIDVEIDNIRAAWNWAVAHQQVTYINQAIEGIYWYTWLRSWLEEGEKAFREAVAVLRAAEPTRDNQIKLSRALTYQAAMDIWLGRPSQGNERAQESAVIMRPLNAKGELAHALHMQGWAALDQQNWREAKALIEEAVVLYNEVDRRDQKEIKAFALNQLGYIARIDGDFAACDDRHQQALKLGREIHDQRTIAEALSSLGHLARWQGHYVQAGQLYEESLAVARAAWIAPFIINGLQNLGRLAMITGQLDAAHASFAECLGIAQDDRKGPLIAVSHVSLARVLIALGEYAAAEVHLVEALQIPPGMEDRDLYANVRFYLGQIAWQKKDYSAARRHFAASRHLFEDVQDSWSVIENLVMLARIALAEGDDGQAVGFFIEALQTAIPYGAPPMLLYVLSGISALFLRQNNLAGAIRLASLVAQHPASEAESKDLAMSVLDAPQAQAIVGQPGSGRDTNADLKKLGSQLLQQLSPRAAQSLVEELSGRELEVLGLVAAGMSNREIARELTLALGTVKSHLHNILQKLDAASRTQAVARARELDLL